MANDINILGLYDKTLDDHIVLISIDGKPIEYKHINLVDKLELYRFVNNITNSMAKILLDTNVPTNELLDNIEAIKAIKEKMSKDNG